MCSESRRVLGRCVTTALGALFLLVASGCGHKAPPTPPPLRNPAKTTDLTVLQRGNRLILTFTHPQTTVGGLPVEPLTSIEYWELVKEVPSWTPPEAVAEGEAPSGDSTEAVPETATDDEVDPFSGLAGAGDDQARPDPTTDDDSAPAEGATTEQDAGGAEAATGLGAGGEGDREAETAAGDEPPAPPPVEPSPEQRLRVEPFEFAATARLKSTISGSTLSSAVFGDRVIMSFPIEPPEAEAGQAPLEQGAEPRRLGSVFAVKTAVSPKLVSPFSNLATIAYREPPPPPKAFSVRPGVTGVTVSWMVEAETDLEGFHVYRRGAQNPQYGTPLAFVPAAEELEEEGDEEPDEEQAAELPASAESSGAERRLAHVDRSAAFGQRYIYTLTAVANRDPVVESAIAGEQEVDYADRFAPGPPRDPIAFAEIQRVRLVWSASPQADVVGYFVLRREGDGDFARLNDTPIVDLEFSDRRVERGRVYEYRILAVDRSNNESRPSDTVEVRVP